MKYPNTKKSIAFLAAAVLACQPVTALAATFADMNKVPWPGAETAINKAADLGLVVGETINGKSYFRPRDTVSLSETCQFAYKVLQQTNKATASDSVTQKWAGILNTYKIQSWAHPAVSFCLENGIISISDLGNFVKNGANMPASREQAAEILGRALVFGDPTLVATAGSTKFADNSSIAADAIPYIALLNAEGIISGDDTGKFNPKKTLNRTETAVMVTNLHAELKAATTPTPEPPVVSTSTKSGTVKEMNTLYVNFTGSNAYYFFPTTGSAAITLNGKTTAIGDVVALFKENKEIKATLTLEGNRITKMVATCEAAVEEEKLTKGKLTKMSYDEDDEDGSITIAGKSVYRIDDVNDVDITVEMDDDEDDYDYDDFYDLYLECKDDKRDITVKLTLKNGDVDKIEATVADEDDDKDEPEGDHIGDIKYLDDDGDEGEIKVGSKTYYIEDIDDVDIQIDGRSKDWDDLVDLYEEYEEDDEYLYGGVTMDRDDEYVIEIDIVTDYDEDDDDADTVEGEIEEVTYDEDDEDGDITVDGDEYYADDTTDIDIDDGDSTIDNLEDLYNAYRDGKVIDVEMEVEGDDVVEITGKVTEARGYLVKFYDDYLTLEGKKSDTRVKYNFDDDEDEMEDVDVDIEGDSNIEDVSNLYEFIEWLTEADEDDDLDLGKDGDEFDLVFTLDKDGNITEISGDYEY